MNLADAIRQAAIRQAEEHGQKEKPTMSDHNPPPEAGYGAAEPSTVPTGEPPFEPTPKSVGTADGMPTASGAPTQEAHASPPTFDMNTRVASSRRDAAESGRLSFEAPKGFSPGMAVDSSTGEPVPMPMAADAPAPGNVVRFEIFLSPEQLSCLFRALVATQHSMLTLREAAAYLRIASGTLEQFAHEGKVPALQIDGRWRFPKSGLDEWVMVQSLRDGEAEDAA